MLVCSPALKRFSGFGRSIEVLFAKEVPKNAWSETVTVDSLDLSDFRL